MAYLPLDQLRVYQLSSKYSDECWALYQNLDWQVRKTMGDQMIRSVDSVGSNIAEGYGRYHYLDKVKFYYNARGSLFESKHWIDLLLRRKFINREEYLKLVEIYKEIQINLNGLISSTCEAKEK